MTRVLLVEDNVLLLEDISIQLELSGYEVFKAENGIDAFNLLNTLSPIPDIIVSDIAMPDMDGYQLLELVRNDYNYSNIPFLFLTAFNSQNAVRVGKELGVNEHLVKPLHIEDLIKAIENNLNRLN